MAWLLFLLKFVLAASAVIIIILVLLQKGKGGGLAGALGGMGGQSAFGTKAGDLFTKITIAVATVWILFCLIATRFAPDLAGNPINLSQGPGAQQGPAQQGPTQQGPGQQAPPSAEKPTSDKQSQPADAGAKPATVPAPSDKPAEKPVK